MSSSAISAALPLTLVLLGLGLVLVVLATRPRLSARWQELCRDSGVALLTGAVLAFAFTTITEDREESRVEREVIRDNLRFVRETLSIEGQPNFGPLDLSDQSLAGLDLSGADLRFADLRFADLSGANLTGADLRKADLTDANLLNADLPGAEHVRRRLHGRRTLRGQPQRRR